ncbi:PREDICTED: uncharacterized protein LOC104586368 isoform X2 [Nelumbo nucifera]|uniref:Uncharacterized protein LOC104586368 isoform X2 n=1 Tax=Nelumbo nucifera TaxID=4432 RepID=A0A1U7YPE7_NELNU|nr:PREDICTED: uncharacterized protein LOC104586368 isoform X2 [Nelumbo nucifera]
MPMPTPRDYSTADTMRPEQKVGKPEEGSDSLDSFIRQAIGREPFLSFPRAGDSPVQWIQLLHALDQQDLPGWPLLSPSKVPMQKCDKCSREFCSPINYRRHIRVHRRSLNIDKDSPKNRDILGAFWDKLSLDESKELVSFKNVTLEEVPGSSIIRALTSFIWKPVFSSLPQAYVKAGSALLDIIQARPSKFPLSSQELFSILDDASENTFLCAGTADSMQKFVFDGEAGKIGLEMKNLVACTSFLVEQKLVKAWIADKDAEALRCQKLLVEEEEAAQKRQAEILEKRRLKKLRQKEQKSKEQTSVEKTDFKESSPETWEDLPSAETTSPVDVSDSHPCTSGEQLDPIQPSLEPNQLLDTDLEADTGSHAGFSDPDVEMASGNTSSANYQNVYHEVQQESSRRQMNAARRQLPKQLKGTSNGFHSGQIPPMSKVGAAPKHGSYRDQRATSTVNGHKVWTRKTKCENEEECSNVKEQREFLNQSDQNGSNELLIGSISVTLGDCSGGCQGNILAASVDQCTSDYQPPRRNNTQEKPIKLDVCHSSTSRSMVKLWRPVGRQEGSMAVQNETREAEMDVNSGEGTDRILSNESCLVQGNIDDNSSESRNGSSKLWEESTDARGLRLFSSRAAAAFLAQRWKEAIAADHVKLVLFPKTGPPGSPEILDDAEVATALPSDCCKVNNLGNAGVGPLEVSPTGPNKAKFRGKPEKVIKLKYIPKQRNGT